MNLVRASIDGLVWVGKTMWLFNEANEVSDDIKEILENEQPDLKDWLRVGFKVSNFVIDVLVYKKDWDASNMNSQLRVKKGDLQKLQEELRKNRIQAAKFEMMGLATSVLHNGTRNYLFDQKTIVRMVLLFFRNNNIAEEDRTLSSFTANAGSLALGMGALCAVKPLNDWYLLHGLHAPTIDINCNYPDIPEAHENDPFWRDKKCPITLHPLRFPVIAPNQNGPDHIFERKAIIRWLLTSPTNPVNRATLHLSDLREHSVLREEIENKMTQLGIPLNG